MKKVIVVVVVIARKNMNTWIPTEQSHILLFT